MVEAAGMSEHCDFSTQEYVTDADGAIRPDMVVRLPGRGRLAVDAKLPLDSYLDALEADDPEARERLLAAHARSVRQKVKQLADKGYEDRLAATEAEQRVRTLFGNDPDAFERFAPELAYRLVEDDGVRDEVLPDATAGPQVASAPSRYPRLAAVASPGLAAALR